VQPDALLLNYKSVVYSFVPDAARGVARVVAEPRLAEAPVDPRCRWRPAPAATGAAR
jgi:serine-type D-Ala-D-Ala carboxypeptidase/endopeptidase (penicillin-binding protein 4)